MYCSLLILLKDEVLGLFSLKFMNYFFLQYIENKSKMFVYKTRADNRW